MSVKGKRKPTMMQVRYDVEVRDRNGKLISKTSGFSRSFLRLWIRMLRTMMNARGYGTDTGETLTNTAGSGVTFRSARSTAEAYGLLGVRAVSADSAYGTMVGTSDVAFDKTHYGLQAKIAHGGGANQLLYGEVTVEDYFEWNSNARFRVIRAFSNTGGVTVTVKEIGIALWNQTGSLSNYFMVCRDVLASPQSVPDGATLTVRYSIYITY